MTKRKDRNLAQVIHLRPGEYGPPRPSGWFAARFIEHPAKIRIPCGVCSKPMWLPPSKAGLYRTCSKPCRGLAAEVEREKRRRECESCRKVFYPRKTQLAAGIGRYCSRQCIPTGRLSSAENLEWAAEGFRRAVREGRITYRRGEHHPQWRGGHAARIRRAIESGRLAAYTRAWRRANPDRVKEQGQRRASSKLARLPHGTIPKIRRAQRDRCAICRVKLGGRGHLDHIRPLARGGEHAPRNLQLLCEPCNVRKNAKDPIDYMRELGRLI